MDSELHIALRITHTQNLPGAHALARLAAATLLEALEADPQLLVTADLESAALDATPGAPAVVLPERFTYIDTRR